MDRVRGLLIGHNWLITRSTRSWPKFVSSQIGTRVIGRTHVNLSWDSSIRCGQVGNINWIVINIRINSRCAPATVWLCASHPPLLRTVSFVPVSDLFLPTNRETYTFRSNFSPLLKRIVKKEDKNRSITYDYRYRIKRRFDHPISNRARTIFRSSWR